MEESLQPEVTILLAYGSLQEAFNILFNNLIIQRAFNRRGKTWWYLFGNTRVSLLIIFNSIYTFFTEISLSEKHHTF